MIGSNDLSLEWATEKQLMDELAKRNTAMVCALRKDEHTRTVMRLDGLPGWCMAVVGDIRMMCESLITNGAVIEDETDTRDS